MGKKDIGGSLRSRTRRGTIVDQEVSLVVEMHTETPFEDIALMEGSREDIISLLIEEMVARILESTQFEFCNEDDKILPEEQKFFEEVMKKATESVPAISKMMTKSVKNVLDEDHPLYDAAQQIEDTAIEHIFKPLAERFYDSIVDTGEEVEEQAAEEAVEEQAEPAEFVTTTLGKLLDFLKTQDMATKKLLHNLSIDIAAEDVEEFKLKL